MKSESAAGRGLPTLFGCNTVKFLGNFRRRLEWSPVASKHNVGAIGLALRDRIIAMWHRNQRTEGGSIALDEEEVAFAGLELWHTGDLHRQVADGAAQDSQLDGVTRLSLDGIEHLDRHVGIDDRVTLILFEAGADTRHPPVDHGFRLGNEALESRGDH